MRNTNGMSPFGSLFTTVTAAVSPVHEVITRQPLYDAIPPLQLRPPMPSLIARVAGQVACWQMRRTQRRNLASLSDRLLEDAGISRREAAREAAKPFWRA